METLTKEIEKVSTNVGIFQSVLSRLQCKSNRLTGTELTIESDNEEQPRETVKGSEGYQENKPAIPQTKSIKEEEEDVQDCQNQEKHLDSASNHTDRERFEKRYGMIIESKNPKYFSYKAVPWTSDERIDIISGSVFPDGFKLDTDIFYIKESTAGNHIDRKNVSKRGVLFKVLLSMENCSYYEYKGAVKYENEWEFINYSVQDGYLVFEVSQVESFCMISSINRHRHTIVPAGSQFISDIDHRIQVKFPPNAVSRDKQIAFKIHPVDLDYILERTTEPTNDEVYAITSGLSTTHMEFKMMFKVQLPLFTISDLCHEPEYINYNILKWTDDGLFQITDIQPVISNGLVSFETNSFSGYCCVGTKRPQISSSLESFVPEIYGLRKWCKILFFVGKISNNSIPIMLECVELQRVSEVCEKRQKYGYHFVSEWISRDLFFTPNSTIITVEVKGRFKIPKESSVRLPRLSFIPVARDNFSHFLVELRGSGVAYGILSLREERKVLYEIYYYPDTKKQPTVPLKKVWNPIIKGSSTKMTETKEIKGKTVNITTNFFSEKGLLTLSEKMNPDTMFKFCLHMNMTSAQYHTIRHRDGYTAMGNLKVIQTALVQQPQKGNLNLVIEALTQAGQKDLAEKVAELHSNKMPLHTI